VTPQTVQLIAAMKETTNLERPLDSGRSCDTFRNHMKLPRLSLICSTLLAVFWSGHSYGFAGGTLFVFKEPQQISYITPVDDSSLFSAQPVQWIIARRNNGYDDEYRLGSKVVMRVRPGTDLGDLMNGSPLVIKENAAANLYVLQAADAWEAAFEAQRLGADERVVACQPDMQRPFKKSYAYSNFPNDPYFGQQWHLENRDTNGVSSGIDLNVRSAWPYATGDGVNIAIVDEGVELNHPDLESALVGMPHFNWETGLPFGGPISPNSPHGTAVAGLAAARTINDVGVAGVAYDAKLVSWIVFGFGTFASGTQLKDMFQANSNLVQVQNHSWSFSSFQQLEPQPIEEVGISNAIYLGREGRGVVMVRSAGNNRTDLVSANDDGYVNDPRIIAVAAVRNNGEFASYSNPGSCILVAAPSGDQSQGFTNVLTTDLQGLPGINTASGPGDFNNYAYFSGTSASAPLISGIAALLLQINPNFSYRDVQQILIQSARQYDLYDPTIKTNQAGYRVGINTGFGVPDAGRAVRLAQNWPLRPALTTLKLENFETNQIPNLGLRIETFGNNTPLQIASIPATPGLGVHPEDLTSFFPVKDVGFATNTITEDLTGKAALIQRGGNSFKEKIQFAADAGAEFAVISNYPEVNERIIMGDTFRSPIPAMFIIGDDGTALRNFLSTNGVAQVRSILFTGQYTNHVATPLLVEHVEVRLKTDHPRRGDLRVTVTSPAGTRSVLQNVSEDFGPGPYDWTYMSTHHFYESSQGVWKIQVSDENTIAFGNAIYSELIIHGVEITDSDHDGLDDGWEMAHFQNLASKPNEDANGDGESNMREYIQGTDPLEGNLPFELTISEWKPGMMRVGWPSAPNHNYDVLANTNVVQLMSVTTNLPGLFDSMDWVTSSTNVGARFLQIRSRTGGQ